MCLLSLGLALGAQRGDLPGAMDWLLGAMVVTWGWTCLQAVPLPRSLAHTLGLASVQNAERLAPVVDFPVPLTISVDPGATCVQILTGIAIVSIFIAARLLEPRHRGTVARAAAVSVALIALSGLAHRVLGLDAVYGVYEPRFTNSRLLSPIMNNNHMSGFLVMGTLVAMGLAADGRNSKTRALWISVSAFCGILVPWTLSRGAIGALVFGIGFWIWAIRHRRRTEGRRDWDFALVIAVAFGGAIFFALEPLLRRFEQHDFSKLQMAAEGLRLLEGPPWWLGVGRGAFSSAFAVMEGSRVRVTHPENLLVQWLTEWGVPVALLLLGVLVTHLWRRFHSVRTATSLGLLVGLLALVLQNMVDFSLEIPAIAVVASASLGALTARRFAGSEQSIPRSSKRHFWLLAGGFLAVGVLMAFRVIGSDTQSLTDRLVGAMATNRELEFEQTLEEALKLHPSEPVFPLLAAARAVRNDDPKAAKWLSIVMAEAPGWGSPHVLTAQWLLRLGRIDQALLEVRQAEIRTPGAGLSVLCKIMSSHGDMHHLERAAPSASDIGFFDRAMRCPGLDPTLRAAIDARILSVDPLHPLAASREARRLTDRGEVDRAVALVESALVKHPRSVRLWETLVLSYLAADEPERALAALEKAIRQGIDADQLLVSEARIFAALGNRDDMMAALTRLRGLAKGNPKKIAASYLLQGDLEASVGDVRRALDAYRAADQADPSSLGIYKSAALAWRAGLRTQAYRDYRELCSRDSGDFACQRRDQLAKELGMQSQ